MELEFYTTKLPYGEEQFIAYQQIKANQDADKQPSIVYLSGYNSDMLGDKAEAIMNYCNSKNYNFVRFDYMGHGQSSGDFKEGTIGEWLQNTLMVIDKLTSEKVILIGSSMGGWLMLLAALNRPSRIASLLGIAAAPDFTDDLIWQKITDEQKLQLNQNGILNIPSKGGEHCFQITAKMMKEAASHMLMREKINIDCPIHLLHGMKDEDVPYDTSVKLAHLLSSDDVTVHLLKNSGHRMSEPEDVAVILGVLENLIIKSYPS